MRILPDGETVRVYPISLSYPFPLAVRVHVRVRANSGFDRGVGVRGRGRYPLKPSIFTSLLETKRYPEHTDLDHPESIFSLNTLFKMTTVLFCALHSPVTYIYIFATMFLIETFLKIAIFHANVTLLICTTVPRFSD